MARRGEDIFLTSLACQAFEENKGVPSTDLVLISPRVRKIRSGTLGVFEAITEKNRRAIR